MAKFRTFLLRLRGDATAASIVEFALLAPVFLSALIGVVETGLYMQNYNAIRNVASDAARFAAVEYQKENELDAEAIKLNVESIAQSSPYNLTGSRLVVNVTPVTARVTGAKEFDLDVQYTPPGFLAGLGMDNFKLTYSRPLFVLDNSYVAPSGT